MKITSVMEFYYCNDITLNMEPHYIKHGIILHYESPETRINKGFFKIFLFFYFLSMPSGPLRLPTSEASTAGTDSRRIQGVWGQYAPVTLSTRSRLLVCENGVKRSFRVRVNGERGKEKENRMFSKTAEIDKKPSCFPVWVSD